MVKKPKVKDEYMKQVEQGVKDRYMKQKLLEKLWDKQDSNHTNCEHYDTGICLLTKISVKGSNKCSAYKKRGSK